MLWFVDTILIDFTKIYLMMTLKFWNKTEKQLTTFYQTTMHPSSVHYKQIPNWFSEKKELSKSVKKPLLSEADFTVYY